MISLPSRWTILVLAALAASTSTVAIADMTDIADRCSAYGTGFVELGNGTCGVRHVEGTRGGTANAGLRSDGLGMLPGAGNARHLRIQLEPYMR